MLAIDALAYRSRLAKMEPGAKLLFGLVPLALCLALNAFAVSAAAIVVMGAVTVRYGDMTLARYLKLLAIPSGFLLMGTVMVIFGRYDAGAALLAGVHLGDHAYGVTPASLLFGARLALKALGAVSCVYFISLNTPMNDILRTLRACRLPALLVSLMELIYRYIFVFLEEARAIHTAQEARLGYAGFRVGLRSLGQLVSVLFLRAYTRCDRVYAALQSRGYEGDFKALPRDYPPGGKLRAACGAFALALAALGVWERGFLPW